jgi:hypothetical protein
VFYLGQYTTVCPDSFFVRFYIIFPIVQAVFIAHVSQAAPAARDGGGPAQRHLRGAAAPRAAVAQAARAGACGAAGRGIGEPRGDRAD